MLRVVAALLVFIQHFCAGNGEPYQQRLLVDVIGLGHGRAGHLAVVVFFVLSGFLIARSADKPGLEWQRYFSDRLGRMYSVVIPAVILDIVILCALSYLDPAIWKYCGGSDRTLPIKEMLVLTFLHQAWTFHAMSFLLGPVWSVGYEFWYYVVLGLWRFLPRLDWKLASTAFILILLGPKVALLAGAWLAGVWAYRLSKVAKAPGGAPHLSGWLFILSVAGLVLPFVFAAHLPWVKMMPGGLLGFSANFVTDTIYSLAVAFNIWCLARWSPPDRWLDNRPAGAVKACFTYLAGISFSIYLFHRPLIVLLGATFGVMKDIPQQLIAMGGILCVIAVLAQFTERKLAFWRGFSDFLVETGEKVVRRLWRVLRPARRPLGTALPDPE